jgi:hypothetical protein
MSTVREIEQAIGKLAPQELDDLYAWMEEHTPQSIDVQLKSDLEAGRMDDAIRHALADHAAGDTREL